MLDIDEEYTNSRVNQIAIEYHSLVNTPGRLPYLY